MFLVALIGLHLAAPVDSLAGPAALSPEARKTLRAQAQEMGAAALRGDAEAMLKRMHPKLVEGLGGHDRALEVLRRQPEEMKKQGGSLVSFETREPTACVRTRKQLQCAVPETMLLGVEGGRLHTESELLAVSYDEGKSWFFVDVPPDVEALRRLLPDVSASLRLHGPKKPVFLPASKGR